MKLPWSRPANNSLGVAGLLVSIAGFFTCGLLSPIGLLLSLAGLLKAPRGAAIAGSVLGLFGSGVFVLVAMSMLVQWVTGGPLERRGDRGGAERRAAGGLDGNEIESLDGLPIDVEVGWATFRSSRFGQGSYSNRLEFRATNRTETKLRELECLAVLRRPGAREWEVVETFELTVIFGLDPGETRRLDYDLYGTSRYARREMPGGAELAIYVYRAEDESGTTVFDHEQLLRERFEGR